MGLEGEKAEYEAELYKIKKRKLELELEVTELKKMKFEQEVSGTGFFIDQVENSLNLPA